MKVIFELSDKDLEHFRHQMRKARDAVRVADDNEIIAAARDVLDTVRDCGAPGFVTSRLEKLETMIQMIEDPDWKASATERQKTLQALAYFADPEDMIPDTIPGLGFLDDAIMVELVLGELRHDLEAFTDYVQFREKLKAGTASGWRMSERLASRRDQLRARSRRRRRQDSVGRRFTFWSR